MAELPANIRCEKSSDPRYPRWVVPHPSHEFLRTGQAGVPRVAPRIIWQWDDAPYKGSMVLVHTADEERAAMAPAS
jgi:hypothetical protein